MNYDALAPKIRKCVLAAGGMKAFCKAVGRSRQAIYLWDDIPAELVVKAEKITGIPREKIRPDLYA
jgi:hypothetical protein